MTFEEEYLNLLRGHKIEFDPRYVFADWVSHLRCFRKLTVTIKTTVGPWVIGLVPVKMPRSSWNRLQQTHACRACE
jgi:hypothetical protein